MYASAGEFTYLNAIVTKLVDVTADGGVRWDTQGNLTVINVDDTFDGSLSWLNYKGHWGNKGFYKCFTKSGFCSLQSGPKGPMQTMDLKRGKRDVSDLDN
jgi:hypothetical protein